MALVTNFKRLEEEYNTHVRGSDDFIRLIELIKEGKSYDANSTILLFEQFIKAEASSLNSSDISKILDKTRDESDKNKSFMIKYYMLSNRSLELTKDDVTQMIKDSRIGNEREIMSLIEVFIKSDKSPGITSEDVTQMIKEVGITGDETKSLIIKTFNTYDFIKGIKQDSDSDKSGKIQDFISDKSLVINIEDVVEIVKKTQISDGQAKSSIIQAFFKKEYPENVTITSDNLVQMIRNADIDDKNKSMIIQAFIEDDKSSGTNLGDVFKMIKDTKITDSDFKYSIIESFIKSDELPKITSDEFVKMIKDTKTEDDYCKYSAIHSFIFSDKSENVTSKDFVGMIDGAEIKNDSQKCEIIKALIKNNNSLEITSDNVVQMINDAKINDENKSMTIQAFMEDDKSSGINLGDVFEMIKDTKITNFKFKYPIIDSFIKSDKLPKINIDDFVEMINDTKTKDDYNRYSAIHSIISRDKSENITSKDVIQIMIDTGIENYWFKSGIIKAFIKSNNSLEITSDNVVQMINDAKINDENKSMTIQAFMEDDKSSGINLGDVFEMIKDTKITNFNFKYPIIDSFIKSDKLPKIKSDEFVKMIKDTKTEDDYCKCSAISSFIKSDKLENINSKDVVGMIEDTQINDKRLILFTIQAFIDSDKSSGITIKDVVEVINGAKIIGDDIKVSVIQYFFNSNKSLGIVDENINQMINDAEISHDTKSLIIKTFNINNLIKGIEQRSDSDKSSNIKDFIKDSDKSSGIHLGDVFKIIDDNKIIDYIFKYSIIESFIKSDKLPKIKSDEFVKMIKDTKTEDDYCKFSVIHSFIKSNKSENITSKDVLEMINGTGIIDDKNKSMIIKAFIEGDKSSGINLGDVFKMIKDTKITDSDFKYSIIESFIKSDKLSKINSDEFVQMIKNAETKDDYCKFSAIRSFIFSDKSDNVTSKDVVGMIDGAGIKNDSIKCKIIKDFFKSNNSSKINNEEFAKMMKEVGLQNRPDMLIDLCKIKFPSPEDYVKNFIDITKALHPSEAMQCEFVKEFIAKNQINQSNLEHLKPFIEGLKDNDLALYIIENLSRKGILKNEKDTLSLVKNRSKKQYSFLTETFGDKALQECITQDGINSLKGIFGNDLKFDDGNPITITALISYCDITNRIPDLSTMLNPEFKIELRNNFSPSADKLLYKPQELEKLNQLLNQDGVEFDANSYFIKNEVLCSHLREKAGVIAEVNLDTIYQINFTNYSREKDASKDVEMTEEAKLREEVAEKERQQGINDLFNKILKQNPSYEDVDNFVSGFFGVFPPKRDDKLVKFFKDNKKELAYCLCKEDLEKDDLNKEGFISLFTTQGDGCYANISMQFKKMLDSTMFKDRDDQIIYATADVKIFSVIGASQDITHNGPPLNNSTIKSYSLSPMALIEKITQEEMLNTITVTEIIDKNIGNEGKLKLFERFFGKESYQSLSTEDGGKLMDKETKEIASYLIIKKAVGEEKMTELENKNPKLKELGDFIYDRQPQLSPRDPLATNALRNSSIFANCQIS